MKIHKDVLESIFPGQAVVSISVLSGVMGDLYESEQALVNHAMHKRQAEFATGRLCAKDALRELGVEHFPVLMDEKRAPLWPEGYTGSITHTKDCASAVMMRVQRGESVGYDVEEVDRLKQRLWPASFTFDEIVWLEGITSGEQVKYATAIFGAKEAFYKAQYPLTHAWLGFQDAQVEIDIGNMSYKLTTLIDLPGWKNGSIFSGKFVFFDKYVAVSAVLRP